MSGVVKFERWRHQRECQACEEGEVCGCTDDIMMSVWRLNGTNGRVQQFLSDGPFYGTWAGGRTGAVGDLEACKATVERAVGGGDAAREPRSIRHG
jgi:hypothetical protein